MITLSQNDYIGNCYEGAAIELLGDMVSVSDENIRDGIRDGFLVHGYPQLQAESGGHPKGTKYGHAWVEFVADGIEWCKDGGTGRICPKALYYMAGKIDGSECKRYTAQEASRMILKHKHWGVWEEVPEGVAFKG